MSAPSPVEHLLPIGLNRSLTDSTYDRLVDAIATDRLPPGTRLNQRDLADQLKVSRQPISHALHRLRLTGLAIETGRKGLVVAPIDVERLMDLYDVRAEIEGLAASRAAARVGAGTCQSEDVTRLRELMAFGQSIGPQTPVLACITADVDFHLTLYRLCGSTVIAETIEPLWPHFRRSMGRALVQHDHRKISWQGHADIADAVLAGKPEAARAAMQEHIRIARQALLKRVNAA